MTPLAPLVLRALLLSTLVLLATPSFAGTKLDLTPYLGNLGMPGDFKVFSFSTGGRRVVTVRGVDPWKKGWRVVVDSDVTGAAVGINGTMLSEEYLIPGKRLLAGNEFYDIQLSGAFAHQVSKPVKGLKLRVKPGRLQRLKNKARLVVGGAEVGLVLRWSDWVDAGFETVSTPSGTYTDALKALAVSGVGINDGGTEYGNVWKLTIWYASGLGVVRVETELEYYEDGILMGAGSWVEELVRGSIDGVPFP